MSAGVSPGVPSLRTHGAGGPTRRIAARGHSEATTAVPSSAHDQRKLPVRSAVEPEEGGHTTIPALVYSSAKPTAVAELPSGASSETIVTQRPCQPIRQNPPSAAPATAIGSAFAAGAAPSRAADSAPSTVITTSPGRRLLWKKRSLIQPMRCGPRTRPRLATASNVKAACARSPGRPRGRAPGR